MNFNPPTICPNCGKKGVRRSTVPTNSVAYGDAYYIYRCRYCKTWRSYDDVQRETGGS